MSRPFAYTILALAGCTLLFCAGLVLPLEIAFYLATGWGFFLGRVGPEIRPDWGGFAIAGGCLVLFAVLAHSFLGWLLGQVSGSRWKVRWTASLVAGVVVMFAAGISAAGIAHQAGWLLTSKEPWIKLSGWAAQRAQSVNNLKQVGLALANYEGAESSLPPGTSLDAEGQLLHGWQARILPFLETGATYDRINFSLPWDDPRNASAFQTRISAYLNPKVVIDSPPTDPAPSHYSANAWVLGGDTARTLKDIPDGLGTTIMTGEAGAEFKPWGHPANWRDPAKGINRTPDGFGSPFPGGANFQLADGSVRFIKNTIDLKVFRALATPNGGETIRADDY